MEIVLLLLLFIPYLVLKYHLTDHDTLSEKEFRRYESGISLLDNGHIEAAHTYFDQQLKANPKSAVAYALRGRCNVRLENYHSAIYDLSQALSFDNTLAYASLDRGLAHMALEEYKEALHEFETAVWFLRNTSADALRLRGLARLHLKHYLLSESDLLSAVELGDEKARFLLTQAPFYRYSLKT